MQSGSTVEVDTAAAAIEAKARNAQRAKKYRKELADQVTVLGGVSKDGTHTHTHTHTTTTIYNVHGNLIGNSTGQGGATISAPVTTGSV